MSVILPSQSPPAGRWAVADYATLRYETDPHTGTGPLVIEGPQLDHAEMWLIDHAVVACTSTAPTEVRWYESQLDPRFLLDGSAEGNFDVADWPAGLQVSPSRSLLVAWEGADPGAVGYVTLQVRVLR